MIIESVRKAKSGDKQAFLKLFQTFEEDIYRMALVYTKNKEDALDVVQETAYRALKNLHGLKEPQFFKTWLIKISIHCAIDLLDKKKKVVKFEKSEDITEKNNDILLSVILTDLINTLDEKEKTIVFLKFYHCYSFREIADMMNYPLGTIKSVLYRALAKLRKHARRPDLYG